MKDLASAATTLSGEKDAFVIEKAKFEIAKAIQQGREAVLGELKGGIRDLLSEAQAEHIAERKEELAALKAASASHREGLLAEQNWYERQARACGETLESMLVKLGRAEGDLSEAEAKASVVAEKVKKIEIDSSKLVNVAAGLENTLVGTGTPVNTTRSSLPSGDEDDSRDRPLPPLSRPTQSEHVKRPSTSEHPESSAAKRLNWETNVDSSRPKQTRTPSSSSQALAASQSLALQTLTAPFSSSSQLAQTQPLPQPSSPGPLEASSSRHTDPSILSQVLPHIQEIWAQNEVPADWTREDAVLLCDIITRAANDAKRGLHPPGSLNKLADQERQGTAGCLRSVAQKVKSTAFSQGGHAPCDKCRRSSKPCLGVEFADQDPSSPVSTAGKKWRIFKRS